MNKEKVMTNIAKTLFMTEQIKTKCYFSRKNMNRTSHNFYLALLYTKQKGKQCNSTSWFL